MGFPADGRAELQPKIDRLTACVAGALEQAEHIRELLERGRYAEARLMNFRLVCDLRRAQLEEKNASERPEAFTSIP